MYAIRSYYALPAALFGAQPEIGGGDREVDPGGKIAAVVFDQLVHVAVARQRFAAELDALLERSAKSGEASYNFV